MRFAWLALLAACGADPSPVPGCGDHALSFKRDVAPLIANCGGVECHPQGFPYASLVNAPVAQCLDHRILVVPGDATSSYLVEKLEGIDMCAGQRMPMGGPFFTDAQMTTLENWICQDAPNN